MALRGLLLTLAMLMAMLGLVQPCVYLFGADPNSQTRYANGVVPYTFAFYGDDWPASTTPGWVCGGKKQSPINVPEWRNGGIPTLFAGATRMEYDPIISDGKNVKVINNGHVVQVEWTGLRSSVIVQVPSDRPAGSSTAYQVYSASTKFTKVVATPMQFHFHSHSEHWIKGRASAMEMHIVHFINPDQIPDCAKQPLGVCVAVVGILFNLDDDDIDNPHLAPIFDAMPMNASTSNYLPAEAVLDIHKLLPSVKSYVTYEGSLTTPPCVEGMHWHVMTEPKTMSMAQLRKLQTATGLLECDDPSHRHHHHHRRSLADASSTTAEVNCTVAGYGMNFRYPQPMNGRPLKFKA